MIFTWGSSRDYRSTKVGLTSYFSTRYPSVNNILKEFKGEQVYDIIDGGSENGGFITENDYFYRPIRNSFTLETNLKNILKISVGKNHIAAVSYSGNLYTWGENVFGQLGLGDTDSEKVRSPELVTSLRVEFVSDVSCSSEFTVAKVNNDKIFSFGTNKFGRTGFGVSEKVFLLPKEVKIPENCKSILQVVTSERRTALLTEEGDIYFWGLSFSVTDSKIYLPTILKNNLVSEEKIIFMAMTSYESAFINQNFKAFFWNSAKNFYKVCPKMLTKKLTKRKRTIF